MYTDGFRRRNESGALSEVLLEHRKRKDILHIWSWLLFGSFSFFVFRKTDGLPPYDAKE